MVVDCNLAGQTGIAGILVVGGPVVLELEFGGGTGVEEGHNQGLAERDVGAGGTLEEGVEVEAFPFHTGSQTEHDFGIPVGTADHGHIVFIDFAVGHTFGTREVLIAEVTGVNLTPGLGGDTILQRAVGVEVIIGEVTQAVVAEHRAVGTAGAAAVGVVVGGFGLEHLVEGVVGVGECTADTEGPVLVELLVEADHQVDTLVVHAAGVHLRELDAVFGRHLGVGGHEHVGSFFV